MPRSTSHLQHAFLPGTISAEAPVLVGVSGGRDSMALLHWLREEGFKNLVVCHLDHGLRAASAGDRKFVREIAKANNLPFESARIDVKKLARTRKLSIETAARAARYEFFATAAKKRKCAVVFLAHHADDQVETFLFNLLRGSGPAGLSGMASSSVRKIKGISLQIIRPFLPVWREEIERYVAAHSIAFRDDASNRDLKFTRNRIRHSVLPMLSETMDRDVRKALWRTAEISRGTEDYLSTQTPSVSDKLSVPDLRRLPLAIQRRVIHAWLKNHAIVEIGFEEIEAVRSLLDLKTARVNLPRGFHAFRRSKEIHLAEPVRKS